MPEHLPGPRYRLKRAPGGDVAGAGNDAIEWLADRSPLFRFGPRQRPNMSQIAYAAHTSRSTLLKIVSGDLPLSAEAMAGLVKASGIDVHNERERRRAEGCLFEFVDEDEMAVAS